MLCLTAGATNPAKHRALRSTRRTIAMATQPKEVPSSDTQTAKAFLAWASAPSFPKAFLLPGGELWVTQQQRDLEGNKQRVFTSRARLSDGKLPPFGVESRGVSLSVPSPSGRRLLVVRNPEGSSDATKGGVVLEVWAGGRLAAEVEVPASVHGAVYADGFLESCSWDAEEERLLYVAEAPPASRTPLWGGRLISNAPRDGSGWRGVGEFTEDWGEQMSGKCTSALFVLLIADVAVLPVRGLPPDSSCGQAVWAPDGRSLVFASFAHGAQHFNSPTRRLGLVYCLNRLAALYRCRAPQLDDVADAPAEAAVLLTPHRRSSFAPRFSPDGKTLLCLSAEPAVDTGAHNATAELCAAKWDTDACHNWRTVVAAVSAPDSPDGFPGLYCSSWPRQPWVSDTHVVLGTTWGSGDAIVTVEVSTGALTRVTPPIAEQGSWALLDVAMGHIAAAVSTPTTPACLAFASAPNLIQWTRLEPPPSEPLCSAWLAASSALEWQLVACSTRGVEGILLRSRGSDTLAPCVVVPHGGPHAACVAGFTASLAFLASQGYAVLQCNYRGSIGFGQQDLTSLLGKAGRQDVDDVIACLDAAIAQKLVDPTRVAVVGGSHGGFLAAHLIGQHPQRFYCAVMRNPVTDISSMVGLTDIPDWCFVESAWLGKSSYDESPSSEKLARMRAVSPIAVVNNVRAPVLMLLGAKDRRVPASNGLAYARALKHRGVTVRTILFPEDEHPLSKPRTEMESFLNALEWLNTHQPK